MQEILETIKSAGFTRLDADEVIEFGKLYRRATAELSFHRTHEADPARVAFLNELLGQCYPYIYVAPRRPWPSVARFFVVDYPRALRRHAGWIGLALLLALLSGLIGYLLTWHDRALADQVLPPDLMAMLDPVVARHQTREDWLKAVDRAPSASFIITNNIKVSIMAFAGGMTAGLLTIYLMVFNGMMLGVIAAALAHDGFATALNFWAFAAPHGVIELTAIFISGGAGLLLGYAIINPGAYPRRVALRMAGAEALKLMLGVAAMLVVAGLIEGFFSPMNISEWIKFRVAIGEGILMIAYFLFAGRRAREEAEPAFGTLMAPLPPV